MKIAITDRRVESVEISIETPHELRALYILLQLIARPEFKYLRYTMSSFDDIPGLGVLCKFDILQNPVRRIYEMMDGTSGSRPTRTQLNSIVLACKNAIRVYNDRLLAFYASDIMRKRAESKLPFNFLENVASLGETIDRDDFMENRYIKHYLRKVEVKEAAYEEYVKHASLIAGFRSIDTNRDVVLDKMFSEFKELSEKIRDSKYINSDAARVEGITTSWNGHRMKPSVFASLCGIGVGALLLTLKSVYDEELKPEIENGSTSYFEHFVNNTWTTFDNIVVLGCGLYAGYRRNKQDGALMKGAVEELADAIPEYKKLLASKGFPYDDNDEITHISTPAPVGVGVRQRLLGAINSV